MLWNIIKTKMLESKDSQITDSENSYTYSQIVNRVNAISHNLSAAVHQKSKCGILCESGLNTALAILACFNSNIIPVPMSKSYGAEHCRKIFKSTKPDFIIADRDSGCLCETGFPVFNIEDNEMQGKVLEKMPDPQLLEAALIMCTSGTSGLPKGAVITAQGLINNIKDIDRYFSISKKDKILIARPLYHCAVLTGELLISLYKGVNICFYDGKYNPALILGILGDRNITVLCGTPTLFNHLALYAKGLNMNPALRVAVLSGECLSSGVAENIRAQFKDTDIYNVYGLTEASPRVSYLPPDLFNSYPESVGVPLDSVSVKIVDDDFAEILDEKDGNLMINAPSVMSGYYNDEKLTAKTIIDGWLYTGDIACKNDEGLLFIKGRADDMIIKAGMNIYPKDIENALIKSPKISQIMARRYASKNTQTISIDVILAENYMSASAHEIMGECKRLLAPYQWPGRINIVNFLPKNASGKIVRKS